MFALARAYVFNILEHPSYSSSKEHIVFIVHSHYYKQLGVSRLCKELLPKSKALIKKFGRVACRGCISHICEFVVPRGWCV